MYRWLLLAGIWLLVGALGALFWLGWQVRQAGLTLKMAELQSPLRVEVTNPLHLSAPLEVRVSSLPLAIPEGFRVAVEGPVHADTGFLQCPFCGKGQLLPVRWNILSGSITWRCMACGREFGP